MSDASLGMLHGLRANGIDVQTVAAHLATTPRYERGDDESVEVLEVDLPFLGWRHRWDNLRAPHGDLARSPLAERVRVAARDVDVVHLDQIDTARLQSDLDAPVVVGLRFRLDQDLGPPWRRQFRQVLEFARAERAAARSPDHRQLRPGGIVARRTPVEVVVVPLCLDPAAYEPDPTGRPAAGRRSHRDGRLASDGGRHRPAGAHHLARRGLRRAERIPGARRASTAARRRPGCPRRGRGAVRRHLHRLARSARLSRRTGQRDEGQGPRGPCVGHPGRHHHRRRRGGPAVGRRRGRRRRPHIRPRPDSTSCATPRRGSSGRGRPAGRSTSTSSPGWPWRRPPTSTGASPRSPVERPAQSVVERLGPRPTPLARREPGRRQQPEGVRPGGQAAVASTVRRSPRATRTSAPTTTDAPSPPDTTSGSPPRRRWEARPGPLTVKIPRYSPYAVPVSGFGPAM